MKSLAHALFTLLSFISLCQAQSDTIKPGDNLVAEGVPPVPASLAAAIKRYTGFYGSSFATWDTSKRAVWLKELGSDQTTIFSVEHPNETAKELIRIPAAGIYDLYFQPQGRFIIYNTDVDGNETFQLHLFDTRSGKSAPLTNDKSRNTEPVWSSKGDRIVYSSSPVGGNGVDLWAMNPLQPESARLLAKGNGNYLQAFDWSLDDRFVIYNEQISRNTVSRLWVVDVRSGERTPLTPTTGAQAKCYQESPQFSEDGKGVYVIADCNSEFKQLTYLDLASKQLKTLTESIKWDVDDFSISPDGRTIAFVTNEDGVSRLHLLDTKTARLKQTPVLPVGIISNLKWHNNSSDLAFTFQATITPGDVYSLNTRTGKAEQWTKPVTAEVDASKFAQPELVHWKSFDGLTISGFLYRPPAKFTGKRPVIIDVHGGPEEQARPGFLYEDNYFLNELGVVKIYPNIRGSSGYGKSFLRLDDGARREDAVKDIGALLDWIKRQPNLDADRVMVQGASYGGYVALSAATAYHDRIRAALSNAGPSNLASFVERTEESWKRLIDEAANLYYSEPEKSLTTYASAGEVAVQLNDKRLLGLTLYYAA